MAKQRAFLEVWVGWLAKLLKIVQKYKFKTCSSFTGITFLLTVKGCKPQVGHNDIAVSQDTSSTYFFLLIGSKLTNIYAYKGSHRVFFYLISENKSLN